MAEWDYDMDYDITMKTPLGKRYGTMHVEIRQGQMNGSIVLLNHKKPFRGTIDREKLYLQLRGERNTFEVCGTPACRKSPPQFAVHR